MAGVRTIITLPGQDEEWLTRVIRERIELEEKAFAKTKREHAAKPPA